MKPTIWKLRDGWCCAMVDWRLREPESSTENYARWISAGSGDTIQEAYEDYLQEVKKNLEFMNEE